MKEHTHSINRTELAAMLTRTRRDRAESQKQIAKILEGLVNQARERSGGRTLVSNLFLDPSVAYHQCRDVVHQLEARRPDRTDYADVPIELTTDDIDLLSHAYHIPQLLFVSLGSKHSTACFQVISKCDLTTTRDFGQAASYSYCNTVIRGAEGEFSFVGLNLDGGGKSDMHSHAGEEILFARKGNAIVHLHDSGLQILLNKRGLLHFYSEQVHSVTCDREGAELFVIRFRQSRRGIRSTFLHELGMFIAKSGREGPTKHAINMLFPSQGQEFRLREDARRDPAGTRVLDPLGLSRFLKLTSSCYAYTLDELKARAKNSISRAKIDRMQNGTAAVFDSDFPNLGRIFACEPLLFYNYVVPSFLYAVSVPDFDETEAVPEHLMAWREVPREYIEDAQTFDDGRPKLRSWIPGRRLTDSDVAVVLLEFQNGATTRWNWHPGWEMLLPEPENLNNHGEFIIEIRENAKQHIVRVGTNDLCAFYDSRYPHRISFHGKTATVAKARVFRFLDNQTAGESPNRVIESELPDR
jgi:quercetin dioxygenase-like cupin family protein